MAVFALSRAEREYKNLLAHPERFPIRFALDDRQYHGFPANCFSKIESIAHAHGNTLTLRYCDTLQVRIETAFYKSYGAYDWTVWFENPGNENSPVISNPQAEMVFYGENPILKGILGDRVHQHRPYSVSLEKSAWYLRNVLGHSTHETFPYFNLEHGDGGTLLSMGWSGTWHASFEALEGKTLFCANGPGRTCTYLKPGEKIRTALFACVCYEGRDEASVTNLWRKWFIECNMPKINPQGDVPPPILTTDNRTLSYVKRIKDAGIDMDYNWIDACWFAATDGKPIASGVEARVLEHCGSWAVDNSRCFDSLTFREFIDASRQLGTKTLVWFAPEWVTHPEDLKKYYGYREEWTLPLAPRADGWLNCASLNNIGNEECFQWTYGRIRQAMDEMNADMYREDMNVRPGPAWHSGDLREGENRIGITENKHIVNHYRLWDQIISDQRKKGMTPYVDSCTGGGGRNDLEAMRRGVPLLRCDLDRSTTALRLSITAALNHWLPYNGTITMETEKENDVEHSTVDLYTARASYQAKFHLPYDQTLQNSGLDDGFTKLVTNEWRKISGYFLKDYYLLTPWRSGKKKDGWAAWEYFDPATDSGVLQAFRMEECENKNLTICLKGLDAGKLYNIIDCDNAENTKEAVLGKELMKGLSLTLLKKNVPLRCC